MEHNCNHLSVHQWIRSAIRDSQRQPTSPIGFLFLKLPPPPCAVLLVKVVRTRCVLYILTWKCASRHNGVQFFMSHLPICLRTRRFSEPTFRPSGTTNHWKNTVTRDFPTFSRICIFCPLTLSLLIFSLLIFLFSLPLPCSAVHIVGSLTSKLPWMI